MNLEQEIQEIREQEQLVNEARDAWLVNHAKSNPEPELLFDAALGKEQWDSVKKIWYGITAGAALYVSWRTGNGIHQANVAEHIHWIISIIITIPAVVSIEGFIAAFGYVRPRSMYPHRIVAWFENIMWAISILLGLSISAVAGLKISMNIAEALKAALDIPVRNTLAILLGVGMTLILFGISEFAGKNRWTYINGEAIAKRDHGIAMKAWLADVETAWRKSTTYLGIAGDKEVQKRTLAARLSGATKLEKARIEAEIEALASGQVSFSSGSVRPGRTRSIQAGPSKTDLAMDYLDACAKQGYEPELQEMMDWFSAEYKPDTLGKSTASEARTKWRELQKATQIIADPFRGNGSA